MVPRFRLLYIVLYLDPPSPLDALKRDRFWLAMFIPVGGGGISKQGAGRERPPPNLETRMHAARVKSALRSGRCRVS
eukprot:2726468-Pleurochrysis_carterae.AAC.1